MSYPTQRIPSASGSTSASASASSSSNHSPQHPHLYGASHPPPPPPPPTHWASTGGGPSSSSSFAPAPGPMSSMAAYPPHLAHASAQPPFHRMSYGQSQPGESPETAKKRKLNGDGNGNGSGGPGHHHHHHHHQAQGSTGSNPSSHDDSPPAPGAGIGGNHAHSSAAAADGPKRIKTARACDSCRRKKIRCDVVDDGSPPPGDPNNGNGGLTCAHCRQYGFSCTFFLPITETRFKKKREREAEEAAARSAAAVASYGGAMGMLPRTYGAAGMGMGMGMGMSTLPPPPPQPATHASISAAQEWPLPRVGPVQRFQQSGPSGTPYGSGSGPGGEPGLASPKSSSAASSSMPSLPLRHGKPSSPAPPTDRSTTGAATSDVGIPPDSRVMGPTSLAYIVHSTAFIPGSAIEAHDLKHSQTFEVGASGDGIIKLNRLRQRNPSCASSGEGEGDDDDAANNGAGGGGGPAYPQIPDAIRGRLAGDVAEKLINSYFTRIGYLHPIITKSEFLHLARPPPLLFYAICGAAALDRNVPREVLSAVRIGLNAIFKSSDVLSSSSANTVKALLILALHADIHGSTNVQSGSRMWNRLGVGLRMAQDLGLHRDASRRDDLDEFAHFLEQKRRIWGACVTADRLVSIALGHPLAIDLTDCDVRLPSPYEVLRYPGTDLPTRPGEEQPFAFNTEMLKLAILFGRVQKTIYSPTGLMKATDEEITGLLSDIDLWREGLPERLRFRREKSEPDAGILHLAFSCLQMLFFRVFMRISYSCPQHLKFSLTIERMTSLIRWSRESIAWVDASGSFYLDTMQFVSYALVFCATVQYHSWVRRGDSEGLAALSTIKSIVSRGRVNVDDERKQDLSLRAKTAEIINLLHESASGQWANTPSTGSLNPTAGVVNRRTAESLKGIVWRNAPGRPGGGAYEAQEPHLLLADLPPGTIILGSNRTPALVRSANGWQQVPGGLPEQQTQAQKGGAGASGQYGRSGEDANASAGARASGLDGLASASNGNGSGNGAASTSSSGPTTNNANANAGDVLPDLSNFTHLGGSVWQDEQGWPVDRRGSGLMVVLPGSNGANGGGFMMNAQNAAEYLSMNGNGFGAGGQGGGAGGGYFNFMGNAAPAAGGGGGGGEAGGGGTNVNPHLNGMLSAPTPGTQAEINGILAANADANPSPMLDPTSQPTAPPGTQAPPPVFGGFGMGSDPLMLNDPLMGILDWQAWQTYLAPGGVQQGQHQQRTPGGGVGMGVGVPDAEGEDEDERALRQAATNGGGGARGKEDAAGASTGGDGTRRSGREREGSDSASASESSPGESSVPSTRREQPTLSSIS